MDTYIQTHDSGDRDTGMEESEDERSIVPRKRLNGANGSPSFAPYRANATLQFSENY